MVTLSLAVTLTLTTFSPTDRTTWNPYGVVAVSQGLVALVEELDRGVVSLRCGGDGDLCVRVPG